MNLLILRKTWFLLGTSLPGRSSLTETVGIGIIIYRWHIQVLHLGNILNPSLFLKSASPSFTSLFYPWGYKVQNFRTRGTSSLTSASQSAPLPFHLSNVTSLRTSPFSLFSWNRRTSTPPFLWSLDLKPCSCDSSSRRFPTLRGSYCLFSPDQDLVTNSARKK